MTNNRVYNTTLELFESICLNQDAEYALYLLKEHPELRLELPRIISKANQLGRSKIVDILSEYLFQHSTATKVSMESLA